MTGKIVGTGSYSPDCVWDNDFIATMVETNDEWIKERTGIARRHIAKEVSNTKMAIEAGKRALADSNVRPEDIDVVIVCTMSPDNTLPCMACIVQNEIGAINAFGYDLNAACSGFLFAYNTVLSYMELGIVKNALIVGSEKLSGVVDWTDRGTCILFGDGAGAVVVSAVDGASHMIMHSDGKKGNALTLSENSKMYMDGQEVFKFAVKKVPESINELLEISEMTVSDIDLFVLHQANRRIVESVAKKLKCDIDKFPMNLDEYGNTSSASIPLLLDELKKDGKLVEGNRIIISGFGAGLSWGSTLIEI
ncbi:MAG: ketoacyl-ACP synthase III [Clostridiales bacterium]|nr:ketoacyl-ACP synthase III [Clostridiales bacterium]